MLIAFAFGQFFDWRFVAFRTILAGGPPEVLLPSSLWTQTLSSCTQPSFILQMPCAMALKLCVSAFHTIR